MSALSLAALAITTVALCVLVWSVLRLRQDVRDYRAAVDHHAEVMGWARARVPHQP